MNIVIIYNSIRGKEHINRKENIKACMEIHNIKTIDMGDDKPLHEVYYDIVSFEPDVVITLDFAGFELRTELDTPSLFKIHCKAAHFVFDPLRDKENMNESFYLGHYVFVPETNDMDILLSDYDNIPDLRIMPNMEKEALESWFAEFSREVRL